MSNQQSLYPDEVHKSTKDHSYLDGEEFDMMIQLVQTARPIPRDQFKDELWTDLLSKASANKSNNIGGLPRFKRLRVAFLLVAIVASSAIVYAASNLLFQAIHLDGGLSVTEGQSLDLSQTINDYTLTAEWIYADGNRISIGLVGAPSSPQFALGSISPNSYVSLSSTDGFEYALLSAVGTNAEQGQLGVVYSFAIPDSTSLEQELSLKLTLDLQLINSENQQVPIGRFQYDLQVLPTLSQTTFNLPQTVIVSGIEITLVSVEVTSSLTRIETCFEVENSNFSDWFPNLELQVGNRNLNDGTIRIDGSPSNLAGCQYTNFYANLTDEEGLWTVKITQLIGSVGLNAEQSPNQPADTLNTRIDGPWIFRLEG